MVCIHIRRGRLTREDGINIAKNLDGKFPWEYLGKSLEDILNPLKISLDEFMKLCDQFTNKRIFKRDENGKLLKNPDNSPIKLNYDNQ